MQLKIFLNRKKTKIRSFLGIVNYCREFVIHYARITDPLFKMLGGERKESQKSVVFSELQRKSFSEIKVIIVNNLERHQPNLNKDFILTTDASDYGIGAVLSQTDENGKERTISCFSKTVDKCQANLYSELIIELWLTSGKRRTHVAVS
jgi:hypothetical protein